MGLAAERQVLVYHAAAFGLPVGKLSLDLSLDAEALTTAVSLHTTGVADLFEPTALAASAEAGWEDGQVRWKSYTLDHVYAAKRRITWMQREGAELHSVITPRYRLWGTPPADPASIATANDPLSSLAALAAAVGASKACTDRRVIFDGKQLYSITLAPAKRGQAWRTSAGPLPGPQLHCALRYKPLLGFDPEDVPKKPIKDADIWFVLPRDSQIAVPTRLRVKLPLGALDIQLTKATRPQIAIDTESPAS